MIAESSAAGLIFIFTAVALIAGYLGGRWHGGFNDPAI